MLEKGRACRKEGSKAYLQLGRYIIFCFPNISKGTAFPRVSSVAIFPTFLNFPYISLFSL